MSRHEMYPMWEKLNYLVGLTYGSYEIQILMEHMHK